MSRAAQILSAAVLYAFALGAQAATVTVSVTPTFAAVSPAPSGYRLYQGTTLIGPAVSGTQQSFSWDTANGNPTVCTKAWNSAGEGTCNVVTLTLTAVPPGPVTTTYVCQVPTPAGQFVCTPTP